MFPILFAGGAAIAALFLTGCSGNKKQSPKTVPPRPKPPEPEYPKDFDPQSEVYKLYQEAKALGVTDPKLRMTDPKLDMGCPTYFYSHEGAPTRKLIGEGDKKIQDCEIYEYILNRWDNEKFAPLAQKITGAPIPWSLDDLDPNTPEDSDGKIRKKVDDTIKYLDQLLEKQGLAPDSPDYHERRIWGLFYFVAYPTKKVIAQFNKNISDLKNKTNRNIIQEQDLARGVLVKQIFEKLSNRMVLAGLQEFQKYLSQHGGLFTENPGLTLELPALKAIDTNTGACTENSKILYAVLKMAGYNPHFIMVDPWKSQHPLLRLLIKEDPLYYHVVLGLNHGGKYYVLDPALSDTDADHQGARISLSLRQYLALDYSNRGWDYFKRPNPQIDLAGETLKKGIQLDPNSFWNYMTKGMWQSEVALNISDSEKREVQLKKSLEPLNDAISINPYFDRSYWARAEIHIWRGRLDEAVADANQAFKLNPPNWAIYITRAKINFNRGNFAGAYRELIKSIKISPGKAANNAKLILTNGYKAIYEKRYKLEELDVIEKELSAKAHELTVKWDLVTLFDKAGHGKLAREKLDDWVDKIEMAKIHLDKQGKSFSTTTIKFLRTFSDSAQNFPNKWKSFKVRIDQLTLPGPGDTWHQGKIVNR